MVGKSLKNVKEGNNDKRGLGEYQYSFIVLCIVGFIDCIEYGTCERACMSVN